MLELTLIIVRLTLDTVTPMEVTYESPEGFLFFFCLFLLLLRVERVREAKRERSWNLFWWLSVKCELAWTSSMAVKKHRAAL